MTSQKPGVEEIEADIARTREELADTIDELTARLNVKKQVAARAPVLLGVAVALGLVVATGLLIRSRRRR